MCNRIKILLVLALFFCLLISPTIAYKVEYPTAGNQSWTANYTGTIPANMTGGGAGGAGSCNAHAGLGGHNGTTINTSVSVTSGTTYNFVIGSAGTAGAYDWSVDCSQNSSGSSGGTTTAFGYTAYGGLSTGRKTNTESNGGNGDSGRIDFSSTYASSGHSGNVGSGGSAGSGRGGAGGGGGIESTGTGLNGYGGAGAPGYLRFFLPDTAVANSNVTSGIPILSVQFTGSSSTNSSPIAAWYWVFGDGNTSTLRNPVHSYVSPGTYSANLTIVNAEGQTSTSSAITITVSSDTPVSSFSQSTTSGNFILPVTFTDTSTNSPNSWNWSFGDGQTSTSQNPSHSYYAVGTYTVTLIASNLNGAGSTATHTVTVGTSRYPLLGLFNVSGTYTWTIPVNLTAANVSLSGGGKGGINCPSEAYCYNGGGNHSYPVNNTMVSVTHGDAKTIIVGAAGTSGGGNGGNTSAFGLSSYGANDSVSTGSYTPGADGWWDLSLKLSGDGTGSSGTSGGNGYGAGGGQGGYAIGGTTGGSGAVGFVAIVAGSFSNYTAVDASFVATPPKGSAPLAVQFVDTSTGSGISSWNWSFGEGNYSSLQNPTHTFPGSQNYTITFSACNELGCNTTIGSVNTDTWILSTYTPTIITTAWRVNSTLWIPSSYTYKAQQLNSDTGYVADYRTLETTNGTYSINTDGNLNYTVGGNYITKLLAIDALGNTYILDTSTFTIGNLSFSGTMRIGSNGTEISGGTVSITQSGSTFSTTTNVSGAYELSGPVEDIPVTFSAIATGYQNQTFTFTPYTSRNYVIGFSMYPVPVTDTEFIKVYGVSRSFPYYQPVAGASVIMSGGGNSTYRTTASNAWGYYEFTNLSIYEGEQYIFLSSLYGYQTLNETCLVNGESLSCA